MNALFPTLFSLAFVAIGAAIISYAIKMARKAQQSMSWPSTDGEVAHSAVLYQTETNSSANRSTFKADVVYRYKVAGADYSSSRVALLDVSSSASGRAQTIVQRYPDKSKVRVYYNPADPADSVLEPGGDGGVGLLYGIGGVFSAGGFFFLVASLTGHVHFAS